MVFIVMETLLLYAISVVVTETWDIMSVILDYHCIDTILLPGNTHCLYTRMQYLHTGLHICKFAGSVDNPARDLTRASTYCNPF